jgi:hypothetical protein
VTVPNVRTRTIRGVELVRVGTWEISTGTWTVTADDLAAAVAAHRAKVLPLPALRIGHTDPRFDGSPALGRIDNLRTTDGGQTLLGDFVGVPIALAVLLPHSYPARSVEALLDYEAPDGTVFALVITGCALLGSTQPGISTLADVGDLYGVDVGASSARRVVVAASSMFTGPADRTRAVAVARARRTRSTRTLTV